MKIHAKPISIHRGSSLMETLHVDGNSNLAGYRLSGYIKRKMSDAKVLEVFDGKVIPETRTLELYMAPSKTREMPYGQFIYYIELVKGPSLLIGSNYVNIQP